jgi:hypothetical protein
LTAVAVNVTLVPAQIVVADADMLTDAATLGLTVMVTVFEVAGEPVTHAALEVIAQVIALLFTRVVVE